VDDVTFCGLALECAPGRVLTPRPATELLVEAALRELGRGRARVVDVGTGSGAVAIALAIAAPRLEVWATDTSACAVELAEENVRRHGLAGRVRVLRGDLLEPLDGSFDLIVANLPYLPAASAAAHPELAGEPAGAVYAPGDGLGPYRRLLAAAEERLTDRGVVVLQLHRRPVLVPRDALALALAA
jgi:release factor glutamine methyltransferase